MLSFPENTSTKRGGTTASPDLPNYVRLPLILIGGSLVMILSAKVTVPFWPVPMTMQVFGTFLLVGVFGGRLAAMMVLTYLAQGALGLPVFAGATMGGPSLGHLLGPTGGYLIGFAAAPFLVELWFGSTSLRGTWRIVVPMLTGLSLIYIIGCAWLAQFVGLSNVLAVGVLPFLVGDLLKVALAAVLSVAIVRVSRGMQ